MGIAVAIGIHSLHVDDATGGDSAAGHLSRAASGAELRAGGWRRGRGLGARGGGPFRIVPASARERGREGRYPEQPPHSSAITTRVPAGRLRSPSAGLNRMA
jgi:hypothetical protein